MRTALATLATVIVLVLAAAAFIYSGAYYIGADHPHWEFTAWVFNEARIQSIRSHARGVAVPGGLDDETTLVKGVSHYSEHCAVCHGAPGVKRGDIAEGLYPSPPNLADSARSYSPAELFWIIKHGIKMTGMPSWDDHSDDELWATVGFIQKLLE
jgi:mono/diheme cytochrome c family protein